jgi:hypothetical protein
MKAAMCNEPIRLRLREIDDLTYRQMWEVYIEPNLKAQEEIERMAKGATDEARTPKAKGGSFDPRRATPSEMNAFLDKLCGGRKYTGPKWWLGEGGVKIHDGKS